MNQQPAVNVICTTYNHGPYIRECLEGFIMQRTTFPFCVIVHDDASTDDTTDIVKEYGKRYPDKFKLIIQKENQYSKGHDITDIVNKYIVPLIDAKYVAFCDGDDCWTSANKLQKQFEYMERNPDCSICVHNAVHNNIITGESRLFTQQLDEKDYSINEVIIGGGGLFSTNSYFIRTDCYLNKPKCFYCPFVCDYSDLVYATIKGRCHYLPSVLTKYNSRTSNSWTERVWYNKVERIEHYKDVVKMLKRINTEYRLKYNFAIKAKIRETNYMIYSLIDDIDDFTRKDVKRIYIDIIKHGIIKEKRKIFGIIKRRIRFVSSIKHYLNKIFDLPGQR